MARFDKPLAGAKVLVVGLAYKRNIDDMRESPSIHLIEILRERGAVVSYHDPLIPETGPSLDHPALAHMISTDLTTESLKGFDCALISTDHEKVDYRQLVQELPLVIDTRNATRSLHDEFMHKIVMA